MEESLATTVEVRSFEEIERMITGENNQGFPVGYFSNVRSSYCGDDSSRCGEEWKDTYYIVADCPTYKGGILGMSNFAKE